MVFFSWICHYLPLIGKKRHLAGMIMLNIPGGKMLMGSGAADGKGGESPGKEVKVQPLRIDKYPVTNADFREFVRAQKYKSEAETFGWSFVFQDFVSDDLKSKVTQRIESAPWWLPVERAFWRQGSFPGRDTAEDGYHGISPVTAFPAQNSYGLYDMMGNTWEWTSTPFPAAGKMYVLRGASWIDTADGSANHNARVTTRMGNTPDSASDNLGFRCAADNGQKPGKKKDKAEL
uniref:Sulfatase-modifying factor enzyme-like domain-containing protein n=1 Tax=Mola mola TaxID=94237 RepID=A0A3Q3WX55_MOLML